VRTDRFEPNYESSSSERAAPNRLKCWQNWQWLMRKYLLFSALVVVASLIGDKEVQIWECQVGKHALY